MKRNKTFVGETSRRVPHIPMEKSVTSQAFREECSLHLVVEKFFRTGEPIESQNTREGIYADFVGCPDFETMNNMINEAKDRFLELPIKARKRFNYSPGEFLDFMQNPDNIEESYSLGLRDRPKPPPPPTPSESAAKPAAPAGTDARPPT